MPDGLTQPPGLTEISDDLSLVLAGYAVSQPDNAAILAPGRNTLTYGGLHAQQEYVRGTLTEWGITRGDIVAVMLPKGPEMAVAMTVLPVCAAAFPLAWNLSQDDYESLFRRTSAKALILPRDLPHAVRIAADRLGIMLIDLVNDPRAPAGAFTLTVSGGGGNTPCGSTVGPDIACILSTSGTTGRRKLIPYPHSNFIAYARAMTVVFRFVPADLSIHLVPMHFAHGVMSALFVPLLNGTAIVCSSDYQAETFFPLLDEFRPTWFSAGFTIYRDILRHVESHRQIAAETPLRFMRSGSGRLEPEEIERLETAFGAPLIVPLSSSETGMIACNPLPPKKRKYESVGLTTANMLGSSALNEVKIRDPNGQSLEPNQEGEIVVRGPMVFRGYLDDPEETKQAFVDGWYRTGDIGKFDEDGFLYLTGRMKEVINRGGEKISPAEIDRVLYTHPDIAEAAAFGLSHPTLGEVVVAAVVRAAGANIDEKSIKRHVHGQLASSKVPVKIFFVNNLPRAENGKLQRNKLPDAVDQT